MGAEKVTRRRGAGNSTMALQSGASASKKRRVGEEGEGSDAAVAAAEEDRISALPEELRLRILALLPLKSAIRTGALSSPWRALWARRWPAPASLDLHRHSGDDPERLHESFERWGRFSLTVHFRYRAYRFPNPNRYLDDEDLQRYLDYAAACDVEDLHIDIAGHFVSTGSMLCFPPGCSRLARLSLRRVGDFSFGYSLPSDAFSALEVIHLHSVRLIDLDHLLSASPRLRTLDLRYCESVDVLGAISVSPARGHLRSLTVAECNNVTKIDAVRACGLRSFRLSSALLSTYRIPATASLDGLYICLRGPNVRNPLSHWIRALPNLASLTILTICSIALATESLCVGALWIGCLFDQVEEITKLKRASATNVCYGQHQPISYLYVLQDLPLSPAREALCAAPSKQP
uniref:F-box domain-containing protein n=1 Tax=Arundo donax TaxID=35708 RepID=A0A0A9CLJ8_ARUDO